MTRTQNFGKASPTNAADYAAFQYSHPLESVTDSHVADLGDDLHIIQTRYRFEIFRFHAEGVGDIVFDIRGIKAAMVARRLPFQMFNMELIDPTWIEHIRTQGGTEAEHMARLTAEDLERPGIAVYWPHNGYTTVIDGNNRLVRRWDVGLRTARMAVVMMDPDIAPFVCQPGGEDKFLDRDKATRRSRRITINLKATDRKDGTK
jgi:hypothetical protein